MKNKNGIAVGGCLHRFCGFFFSDLSAAEVVVPASGKAMVPTDLSIAIPEGTYARVGEHFLSLFFSVHSFLACAPGV